MRVNRRLLCLLAFAALNSTAQQENSGELENLLNQGTALSHKADYAHAIPLLKQAVKLAPGNANANYLLGVALLQGGHAAEAVAPLRVAAESNPVNEAAEGYLGDAAMELNDFALAAETFQTATARSPDSEQALVWWTDYCLDRYRVLEFSLRASPRGRAALLRVAARDSKTDMKTKESLLSQAAALDSELFGVYGELGVAQAQLGMEAAAQANLKIAQQVSPGASSTLELEAVVDATGGNWPNAEAELLELSKRSRRGFLNFWSVWPRRLMPDEEVKGVVWECLREGFTDCPSVFSQSIPEGALQPERLFEEGQWERLTSMSPPPADDAISWFWRGTAFGELGDRSQAIPALERGLQAGAEAAAAQLTSCYELEAIRTADRLKTQGKEASVHQLRGDILLSIRLDASKAVFEYTEALKLRPKNPRILQKLAEAYISLGDMGKARQSAQAALDQEPHNKQTLRLLIQVAMSERDYTTALTLLGQLAAMEPDNAWARVQEATSYAQTGHPEDAVQRLKPALDAGYPDEKGALHALLAGQLRKLGRDEDAQKATAEAIRLADSFQERPKSKSN